MRSKSFLLILSLVIIGLAVLGYFKAMPGAEDQNKSYPQIEIMPQSFDFGDVEYGKVLEYVFRVKNTGKEVMEIKRVATSCACTSAEVEKEIIEPNEDVDLKVIYNTGLMSGSHAKGKQERIIYVKSNDPINPQAEVMIYANVK